MRAFSLYNSNKHSLSLSLYHSFKQMNRNFSFFFFMFYCLLPHKCWSSTLLLLPKYVCLIDCRINVDFLLSSSTLDLMCYNPKFILYTSSNSPIKFVTVFHLLESINCVWSYRGWPEYEFVLGWVEPSMCNFFTHFSLDFVPPNKGHNIVVFHLARPNIL